MSVLIKTYFSCWNIEFFFGISQHVVHYLSPWAGPAAKEYKALQPTTPSLHGFQMLVFNTPEAK